MLGKPPPPSAPPTELGRLQVLSPTTAGIRVSPLAFGGGNIGNAWSKAWGQMTKERAFELLDAFFQAGGNFIDTANYYQDGESEVWLGEWISTRKIRDQLVIATKYTCDYGLHDATGTVSQNQQHGGGQQQQQQAFGRTANHGGNHRRSLHVSVRDSLLKLQTDYIDILYLHWWEYATSIEEVMDSLHLLVQQGKILYLGVSDTPAWVVSAANTYARSHGKTQFSVYSGKWNLLARDLEREILPMARAFGMALAPWGVVGNGKFQSRAAVEARRREGQTLRSFRNQGAQSEAELRASDALAAVAAEHGDKCSVAQVALAYVVLRARRLGVFNVFPVIGVRTLDQLRDNVGALTVRLTDEQVASLESVASFEPIFPYDMIGEDPRTTGVTPRMVADGCFLSFPGAGSGRQ
ncbi:aryl-alcohol dehydrogenase AAD14 [Podospora didyma]|uniref:Aryl-alcohol dehydrogenase AAD14 n=1 Tax=Podospora didyma TaxID=330526 RepID=A0AAE0N4L6_9PEZI|nr:aryl-alcohol dehydrogenase AAD14 [Podospora didyma]